MSWVVDQGVLAARNRATAALGRVVDQATHAANRGHTILRATQGAVGGHPQGDRVAADLMRGLDCVERARRAASNAVAEARQINTMKWVSDR